MKRPNHCYAPPTLPVDGDGGADQRSPCSARVLMSATSEVVLCAAAAVAAVVVVWEAGSGTIWIWLQSPQPSHW